jgi:hypothetical protein
MNAQIGRLLIFSGIILIVAGVLFLLASSRPNLLSWFGNLPGDFNIKRENTRIFVPITTMIVLSVFLTLIVNLIRKIF